MKACVEWLHREAESMNDPRARAILNTAALGLGVEMKRGSPPPKPNNRPPSPSPYPLHHDHQEHSSNTAESDPE